MAFFIVTAVETSILTQLTNLVPVYKAISILPGCNVPLDPSFNPVVPEQTHALPYRFSLSIFFLRTYDETDKQRLHFTTPMGILHLNINF
jgi:hypothetical protein